MKWYQYRITDSTNNQAKRFLDSYKKVETPIVITSLKQTEGRGTRGRDWYSESSEGLYLSILINRPKIQFFDQIEYVHQKVAEHIVSSVYEITGVTLDIKWPNDLMLNKKKCGGILFDTQSEGNNAYPSSVITGIGLNINQGNFPDSLSEIATSIFKETQKRYELYKFVRPISRRVIQFMT